MAVIVEIWDITLVVPFVEVKRRSIQLFNTIVKILLIPHCYIYVVQFSGMLNIHQAAELIPDPRDCHGDWLFYVDVIMGN